MNFINDDILYYAASLSFFTILAFLPILALLIVIISTLTFFDTYIDEFVFFFINFVNPTHSEQLLATIYNFLSNASQLSTLGLIYFFFSFILFFRDYDHIVNKILHIKEKKFFNMFFVYMLFLLFLPIIFVLYTLLLTTLNLIIHNEILEYLVTFIINFLFFIFLFKISINKKISMKAMIISTFFVVITLSIFKYIFIFYTLYNKTYITIYGSFNVLMFFFIWLYSFWLIYLYGIKLQDLLNDKLR